MKTDRRLDDAGPMSIVVAVVVVFFLLSLFAMGHPTSVIARKTEQSDGAEILAYLPGLQFVPMIWASGGAVWRFLLLTCAVGLSCLLMHLAAGALRGGALAGAMQLYADWAFDLYLLGWTGTLGYRIAERRELPGPFGLLLVLPLLNLVAIWVIAFHDGWARPHRGGVAAALALVLALVLPVAYFAKDLDPEAIEAQPAEWGEARVLEEIARMETASQREAPLPEPTPAEVVPPSPGDTPQGPQRSIRALFDLRGRFETLDALTAPENMRIPDHRSRALGLVRNIRRDLEALHGDLDTATYEELANHLNQVEAALHYASDPDAGRRGPLRLAERASAPGTARGGAPAAAAPVAADPAPVRPFPVEVASDCPPGTELRSRDAEDGDEEWCQQLAQYGGLRHGWYTRYDTGGKPEQVGEYREGLRVGVWTRFYPSGAVRAQAEFEAGLQEGWLLTFSQQGERQKAVRFEDGVAVR